MDLYAIALGSNRRHGRHGAPAGVIRAAVAALAEQAEKDVRIVALSAIAATAPIGLAGRRFANAAALIATPLSPDMLLDRLKALERSFGRRRGRRWDSRVLDLDIILWSGGTVSMPGLTIPHTALRHRRFVLDPLAAVVPTWRVGPRTIRQWRAILGRPRPLKNA